ncbi:sigma-54-dependent transcriptional regulator [Celerinatantimonas diazotrophica]|uniref:Two-component system C4-dicarboxylate transport response regulator DctD n=1 Tax=Celerinatantimonas diazotrophica TaxID=412034 RepID=A0A4R1J8H1_9GAMM|nr:sigma-54 dependent transcriptional regulator [Celerinatantimonas diazotrophica]TCK46882.1 two-component system C4-dicarboxylate transport response regulator DctD [Celerinatantimonas diazotrophica]CAG9295649.1 C4-dicarboxylate transport transcriptional regulatory protein DctD [Celerinatantimonas diazotrophica]
MSIPVMLIDDDPDILRSLGQTLMIEDFPCQSFSSAVTALKNLDSDWPGVIITDINMPQMDGLTFMHRALAIDADLPIILLTGHGDISTAVQAMRDGAYDFLEKPFSSDHLLEVVARAAEKRQLTQENRSLRQEIEAQSSPGPRILGISASMVHLRKILTQIKDMPADVLIHGETGSGKELIARFLHDHSNRRQANFVAINCGAIPETMIESELFGFEAGAFTGANKKRIGKIAYADGGTLFLDEIESMPMPLQIKLLRVLEERSVEPLGSNQTVALNIRIVAATKCDLKAASDEGWFRRDLYYRLNVVTIEIPPLRERREDIPLLWENFIKVACSRYQLEPPSLSKTVLTELAGYDWPGNVRELRNLAERLVLMGEDALKQISSAEQQGANLSLSEQLARFEKTLLQDALTRHQGNLKAVQEDLNMGRKTLYEKMRKYQLDKQDFKDD